MQSPGALGRGPGVPDHLRCLPSFCLIGPPRTGTSWLHGILAQPVLLPNPTKETRFFDIHFRRGMQGYRSQGAGGSGPNRSDREGGVYLSQPG